MLATYRPVGQVRFAGRARPSMWCSTLAPGRRLPPVALLLGARTEENIDVGSVPAEFRRHLGAAIPTTAITVAAALAFVAFGIWTLRGDELSESDEERAAQPARNVVLAVGGAFFLAELGDKTMLATITLATTEGLFGTWLGSTVGMVAADALAIIVGQQLGAHLPERAVRIGASILFFAFAAALLYEAVRRPAP
jgi:putative Ca2+/H+ antiporter (TMEM165/GDT1 family)